jgi:hypothetical protein
MLSAPETTQPCVLASRRPTLTPWCSHTRTPLRSRRRRPSMHPRGRADSRFRGLPSRPWVSVPRSNFGARHVLTTVSCVCAAFVAYARQQGVSSQPFQTVELDPILRFSHPFWPCCTGIFILGRDALCGRRICHHALDRCRPRAASVPPRRKALYTYRERYGQSRPHVRGAATVQRQVGRRHIDSGCSSGT